MSLTEILAERLESLGILIPASNDFSAGELVLALIEAQE